MIPICMIVNSKYLNLIRVALSSIFIHTKSKICLYLVYSELKKEEINKIKLFIKNSGNQLLEVIVDKSLFSESPILHNEFSKEGYYKLLLPDILPVDISKILYLDVDVIINMDLEELYQIDIGKNYFGAIADYMVNKKMRDYIDSLGFSKEELYINTGVLLINLAELRIKNNFSKYLDYIKTDGENFKFHDQQVINYFYHDKFTILEEKYNYNPQYRGVRDFIGYFLGRQKKPKIIHYSGMKPWYPYYWGKYYKEFWKYASRYVEVDHNKKGKTTTVFKTFLIMWNSIWYSIYDRKN